MKSEAYSFLGQKVYKTAVKIDFLVVAAVLCIQKVIGETQKLFGYPYFRLIGQKELVKIAVEIEISVFMAILSCF